MNSTVSALNIGPKNRASGNKHFSEHLICCFCCCQTPVQCPDFSLWTLFSPFHKKNKNNNKNPHQNLPDRSKLQVLNFAHGLSLMEDNLPWKMTSDRRQPLVPSIGESYIPDISLLRCLEPFKKV